MQYSAVSKFVFAGCWRGINPQAHENSGWNGEFWCYSHAQAQ